MTTAPQPDLLGLLGEIAKQAFTDALEISCLIENIRRQNAPRINATLSERGAGNAALALRNSMVTRANVLVARCYEPLPRGSDNLNVRRAFDEILKDPEVRSGLIKLGQHREAKLLEAEMMWECLSRGSDYEPFRRFRDTPTAHFAERSPKIGPWAYGLFFEFAMRTAYLLHKLAHAAGVTTEKLDDHFETFAIGAQNFWAPWDRTASRPAKAS